MVKVAFSWAEGSSRDSRLPGLRIGGDGEGAAGSLPVGDQAVFGDLPLPRGMQGGVQGGEKAPAQGGFRHGGRIQPKDRPYIFTETVSPSHCMVIPLRVSGSSISRVRVPVVSRVKCPFTCISR